MLSYNDFLVLHNSMNSNTLNINVNYLIDELIHESNDYCNKLLETTNEFKIEILNDLIKDTNAKIDKLINIRGF